MQKGPLNWKANKRMEALGVDEAAREAFEREKSAGCVGVGRVNFVTFTENWMHYDSGWSTALFPLREIASFQKICFSMGRGVDFYVKLSFKDGGKHKMRCEFEELDEIAAALAERCPQAKAHRAARTFL